MLLGSLPLLEASGFDELDKLLKSISKEQLLSANNNKKTYLPFSFFSKAKPKTVAESLQGILYKNGEQRILVVTNGREHYCYDVKQAKSIMPVLSDPAFHDVSGIDAQRHLKEANYDVLAARNLSLASLPPEEQNAIRYGYDKIMRYIADKPTLAPRVPASKAFGS